MGLGSQNILQDVFFCVQRKKETRTGLLNNYRIFISGWTIPLSLFSKIDDRWRCRLADHSSVHYNPSSRVHQLQWQLFFNSPRDSKTVWISSVEHKTIFLETLHRRKQHILFNIVYIQSILESYKISTTLSRRHQNVTEQRQDHMR